ncbi:MAG: ferrous iron transport protein B [Cytophagaceae bacterium]
MSLKANPKVALIGNPNSGKSSLFNHLTGLHQKVGNFPGVTVDRKTGKCKIHEFITAEIIDLPGTYSLYPKSRDEQIVFDFLTNPTDPHYPDIITVVVDASNLKRNLLLFTQIRDLGFPVILVFNMMDIAEKDGLEIDIEKAKKILRVPVVSINGRDGKGLDKLKQAIANPDFTPHEPYINVEEFAPDAIGEIKEHIKSDNAYLALQYAHQFRSLNSLSIEDKNKFRDILSRHNFNPVVVQSKEIVHRYEMINIALDGIVKSTNVQKRETLSGKIDKVLTHKVYGYLSFLFLLFLIFQAIFSFAEYPMELIDSGVGLLRQTILETLPDNVLVNLLADGILAGLGGILMFIPQIAILFGFVSILEESGYMSRVMFLMDKIMRKFGMNGKSVIPLVSGIACAVPAIMATRNIDNWKERMITIFVTPFISCSARIPVYTILIALVVPQVYYLGVFNLQGLVLMGLYLLGFVAAILTAWIMKLILKTKEKGFFIMEYPSYKIPRLKNVVYTIFEKVKTFVFEAGKVIMAISLVLWVLASYGPGDKMDKGEEHILTLSIAEQWDEEQLANGIKQVRLENSYAGHFGKFIEPGIRPLGFDWKIGIALITSFAAREVFVGTMATIYNLGDADTEVTLLIDKMRNEINPATLRPLYTPALGMSLLVFYVLAMQCMSTLAVVYRETKSWTWPAMQFVYMTALAYLMSFLVYNILS